jgi:SAM-dependent methyltransferase
MELENLRICNLCESHNISPTDENDNIYQCKNCGYVFYNPRPTWDEIVSFYSRIDKYDSWLEELEERDLLWKRRLRLIKRHKGSGSLLDVGTGIAQFLFFARNNFKVKGTEISQSAITIAKQKYNIDVSHGEIESIEFNSKFDVITLFHVLEHVPNPLSTIKRCKELLNNEGILIIAVPNNFISIKSVVKRLLSILKIGRFRNYGRLGLPTLALNGSQREIHLSHFTPSVLKGFLERNGFIVIRNTLDPYYAAKGIKKVFHDLLYFSCLLLMKAFKVNLYDTIWMVAKSSGVNTSRDSG